MKKKKTELHVSKGCEGCKKNCTHRGCTVNEVRDISKYGCNTSK